MVGDLVEKYDELETELEDDIVDITVPTERLELSLTAT